MNYMRLFARFVISVVLSSGVAGVQAQQNGSMLDGNLLAAEVPATEIVQNAAGDVVQVRVDSCDVCDQAGYLPSRNLKITYGKDEVLSGQLKTFNGRAATVVINRDTGMVDRIMFWRERGVGDE
ncbi:hypothetical protein QVZ43_16315 [Marinobacter sp. chi1]|uniref:Uncharacterized protein n=1 Tax=Marinobacter suaedae TaxID=3057675 RepID=A0ABT8W4W4_9GAMM|nr:hypothetical protein [Marinobacter sp. chi1]MDO3723283.1 hypothetical protein [Marinobacter sp. chi1]